MNDFSMNSLMMRCFLKKNFTVCSLVMWSFMMGYFSVCSLVMWCLMISNFMMHGCSHSMMHRGGNFMHYRLHDFVMDRDLSMSHNRLMMCRLNSGLVHYLNWLRIYNCVIY